VHSEVFHPSAFSGNHLHHSIKRNPFPIQLMLTNCTSYLPLLQFISRNILGADIFRLNFSHGEHQQKADLVKIIRDIEKKYDHPIAILADLQVHN
jgi:Pyruvate kinase, barrel domain